MTKIKSANPDSPDFKVSEWERRQRSYWQPVLYFHRNREVKSAPVDFCMCAKNACSTVKVFFTWIMDKDLDKLYSEKYYEFYKDWANKKNVPPENAPDQKVFLNYGFENHFDTRRFSRVKHARNLDTDIVTFFRKKSSTFAIKRDPIKRFLSSYTHTHVKTGPAWHGNHEYSIEDLIEHMKDGTYWNEHLETQSWWMGEPNWYDHVYHINDTKKCLRHMAGMLGVVEKNEIPDFHFMKNPNEKPEVTRKQISMIEQFYIKDYENGWY